MNKAIVLLALPALLLYWHRPSSGASVLPAPPAPAPAPAGVLLEPGVYWTFLPWTDMLELAELFARAPVTVEGVYGEPGGVKNAMVVFEVHLDPLRWTLSSAVHAAPRGVQTQPEDVFELVPLTPAWRRWMEERAAGALDVVREYDRQIQEWVAEKLGPPPKIF